ncbi:hypothetical protein SK854_18255 [Lentzea sp. BCCO 10_0061]|uniref:SPOR domain-containing protein n=1 Tax=Lentzea sokolovensis TaxID=3095429 RepID=A0ABU4UX31_9PSEU|nr:hypothetical protein [Lentzea sp. BCCO 10_0061]MDX8144067.1 hypothetical protein [Lentzea sp. BCCO 10_0061]
MNWQDELRKLDDELASGRISADDYRVRRDQVLSSSNTSGQQASGQQPRWQAQPPSAGPSTGSQATQYITPVGGGEPPKPNPDATQVVTPRPADADRTQVVPGGGMPTPNYGPPSPAHGFQQPGPPPPPWQASDQTPPWVTPSNDNWMRSGPEVFDESSSGKGKKVFAIIGAILVVALIGGSIWWFGLRGGSGGGENTTAGGTSTTSSSAKPKTALELLPAAPGTADPNNGDATAEKLVTAGFLTAEDAEALTAAGVQKIAFKGGKEEAFVYHAEVFEADSAEKATKLAADLADAAGKTGMVEGARGLLPAKSKVLQLIKQKQNGTYQMVYAAGKQVVRATTVQEPIGDSDADLIKKFQEYGFAVSKKFPIA